MLRTKLGVTGFQSSCADLSFLRRSRHIEGPFMIMMAENALYPQTDPREKLDEALTEWKPWLKEQAEKNFKTQATRIQTFWHIGRNWPTQR